MDAETAGAFEETAKGCLFFGDDGEQVVFVFVAEVGLFFEGDGAVFVVPVPVFEGLDVLG